MLTETPASPSAAAPGEQVVRPSEGLARGVFEAPSAFFYGAAGALFVTCGLYAARRLSRRRPRKAGAAS